MYNRALIIKNTFFLYARMILLMCISFYTSRVVLHSLGEVDFGISNVVGGFASSFVFFRSSLANVTQRYLNIEMGKNNREGATRVFRLHLTIYIVLALVVFILAETLGLWFVRNKLVIPEDRMAAAIWVFHFMAISFVATIISVVYDSVLIAHENMKIYSYVGVVEALLKLMVAYIISHICFDRLVSYQFLIFCVAIGLLLFYAWYCHHNYAECSFKFYWNKSEVYQTFSMVGWNTVGTFVWAVNDQGINILLNLFFGPVVNAARGISFQLSSVIGNFGENLQTAVQPQIVKSFASNDIPTVIRLFMRSSKFSIFLLWIFCLPVILCIDSILKLWLGDVPEYSSVFCLWTLAFFLINAINRPVWTLALASGDLRNYVVWGSLVYFLAFPASYICLKNGCSPVSVFVCVVVARIVYCIVTFCIVQTHIHIPVVPYIKQVLVPVFSVVGISLASGYCFSLLLPPTVNYNNILVAVFSLIVYAVLLLTIGLSREERDMVKGYIISKI